MPSPSGIFTQLTNDEIATIRASALDAISSGRRTSLSGGAKSGSKEWQMTPQEILAEVKYALQQRGTLPGRVTKTYGSFTGAPPYPVVSEEQV